MSETKMADRYDYQTLMGVPKELIGLANSPVALKADLNKIRMELLSVPALEEISKVLTFGANKYSRDGVSGDNNWRKGFAWSRLYGASMRHLTAHMSGQDKDAESGLSHLAHLGCCTMFLLEHEICGLGTDDRHKIVRLK